MHAEHNLPAAGPLVAPETVGERALLDIAVPNRRRDDPASGLHQVLFDVAPLGAGVHLVDAHALEGALGESKAGHSAHGRVGLHQKVELLLHRHRERVDLEGCSVGPPPHGRRAEPKVGPLRQGAGPRDVHGERGDPVDFRAGQHWAGRKPPRAVGDHAHAEPLAAFGQ